MNVGSGLRTALGSVVRAARFQWVAARPSSNIDVNCQATQVRIDALEPRLCLSAATSISFEPAQLYNTPATMVATGDFDHFHGPDLVAVNATQQTVRIFLNNGDGTFAEPPIAFTLNDPRWAAVADFNGDGNLDIAVADPNVNGTTNDVDIFYGTGDGNFLKPVAFHTERAAHMIVAADMNGDGLPDLVLANPQRVSVMMNLGDGTFAPPVFYPAGPEHAQSISVADFNGDGAPDLAVVRSDRKIELLLNQTDSAGHPTGTLLPRNIVANSSLNPIYATDGDFNNDGKADLAVANSEFRVAPVTVLLGNGDATFAPKRSLFGGNFVDAVATADFNGDGNADIVTGSFTSGMRVYLGNGDGSFGPDAAYIGGRFGIFATTADLNGDGTPDVIMANGPVFRVLLNDTGSTTPPPVTTPTTGLDVTLDASHPVRFMSVQGFASTITLAGLGSGVVHLNGANLAQNGNQITGDQITVDNIALTGTTAASTLGFAVYGRDGLLDVGTISDDGSLGRIDGSRVRLTGGATIAGSASQVTLDSAVDCNVTVAGDGGGAGGTLSLNITRADGLTLQSAEPVRRIDVGQWISSDGTAAAINAPSIGTIDSTGSFAAGITTGSLPTLSARQVSGGTWNITGRLGTVSVSRSTTVQVNAGSIGNITLGGALIGSTIRTTGDINTISATGMESSDVYAGVGPELLLAGQILPASAADLTGTASIGSISIRTTSAGASFVNSAIAASSTIRIARLGTIQMGNNGVALGLAAREVNAVSGQDSLTRNNFAIKHPAASSTVAAILQGKGINPQDFVFEVP